MSMASYAAAGSGADGQVYQLSEAYVNDAYCRDVTLVLDLGRVTHLSYSPAVQASSKYSRITVDHTMITDCQLTQAVAQSGITLGRSQECYPNVVYTLRTNKLDLSASPNWNNGSAVKSLPDVDLAALRQSELFKKLTDEIFKYEMFGDWSPAAEYWNYNSPKGNNSTTADITSEKIQASMKEMLAKPLLPVTKDMVKNAIAPDYEFGRSRHSKPATWVEPTTAAEPKPLPIPEYKTHGILSFDDDTAED